MLQLLLAIWLLLAGGRDVAASEAKEVFSCTFRQELAKPWRTIGGTWEAQEGCLEQVNPGGDDPNKAVLVLGDGEDLSDDVTITAKLRLDVWKDDDWARAGVGLCCDPESGHGLNLVFHRGQLQFMHDYVAWGPGCAFPYKAGSWYWVKLSKTPREMKGKAWRDGDPEPADWMTAWTGTMTT